MRFPWLQVDADFVAAHAGDLGAHLGISRREAMGLALDLWTWALARASDDAPPDGVVAGTGAVPDRLISGSVGWPGPVDALPAALVACGLAVRIDDGYRLTGFGRYRATWEKNRRRAVAKPERNRSGTGAEPGPKTQTQTQKEDPSPATAGAAQGSLGIAPEPRGAKRSRTRKDGTLADPRHAPLSQALEAAGWPHHGGRTAGAVKELLVLAERGGKTGEAAPAEVLRRAALARAHTGFPLVRELHELVRMWGHFATAPPPVRHGNALAPAVASDFTKWEDEP